MNVSSECVDSFHYYIQLELHSYVVFRLFWGKCSADRS